MDDDTILVPLGPLLRRFLRFIYISLRDDVLLPTQTDPHMPEQTRRALFQSYCRSTRQLVMRVLVIVRWARSRHNPSLLDRKRLREEASLLPSAVAALFGLRDALHAGHRPAPVFRSRNLSSCANLQSRYSRAQSRLLTEWACARVPTTDMILPPGFVITLPPVNGVLRVSVPDVVVVDLLYTTETSSSSWVIAFCRVDAAPVKVSHKWADMYKREISRAEKVLLLASSSSSSSLSDALGIMRDASVALILQSLRLQCEEFVTYATAFRFAVSAQMQALTLSFWGGVILISAKGWGLMGEEVLAIGPHLDVGRMCNVVVSRCVGKRLREANGIGTVHLGDGSLRVARAL